MVREWGFSTEVGPIGYGPEGPSRDNPFAGRPYAEETQRSIDREVAKLLREAESRATTLLRTNLGTLGRVVDLLLERETIDGSDLAAIVGVPERHAEPAVVWAPHAVAMTPSRRRAGPGPGAQREDTPGQLIRPASPAGAIRPGQAAAGKAPARCLLRCGGRRKHRAG